MPVSVTHPPPEIARVALYHVAGAMPRLRSHNDAGPTLYALYVYGLKRGTTGAACLCGPAIDMEGTAVGWPQEARDVAPAIFAGSAAVRRAGDVLVVTVVQVGRETHCSIVTVPTFRRSRACGPHDLRRIACCRARKAKPRPESTEPY